MVSLENKVIYNRKYLHSVKRKVESLLKKVQCFQNKIEKGMPSFWDNKGNIISQEDYQVILVQKRNEDDKFEDLERHMKGLIVV